MMVLFGSGLCSILYDYSNVSRVLGVVWNKKSSKVEKWILYFNYYISQLKCLSPFIVQSFTAV